MSAASKIVDQQHAVAVAAALPPNRTPQSPAAAMKASPKAPFDDTDTSKSFGCCGFIRFNLAELKLRSSHVLQKLGFVTTVPTWPIKVTVEDAGTAAKSNDDGDTASASSKPQQVNQRTASPVVMAAVLSMHHVPSDIFKPQLVAYTNSDDDPELLQPALDDVVHLALMRLCTTSARFQYACRQLDIPLDAIKTLPEHSKQDTMDLALLQKQIQQVMSANHTPLLVVADVGASLCGYVDNRQRVRDVCKKNNMSLHATGHCLDALACAQSPSNVNDIVHPSSLPNVQLHSALSGFESDPILSRRLNAMSLWKSLKALDPKAIAERLLNAFRSCSILFEIASKCEGIRVLSHTLDAQTSAVLSDIINSSFDVHAWFDAAAPVVVYQFDGSTTIPISPAADNGAESGLKPLEKLGNASYFDRLNSWLGQILQRDCPNFDFEVIEHPTHGSCIRYCPLELGLGEQPPTSENLESFAQSLEAHVDILRATIKHKARFIHLVEKSNVLRLVLLPEWAGMGGVRFVPEGWESLLTDQAKTELNKLNIELVKALKSTYHDITLGEDDDGLICVRFGMATHETKVEELLDLVVTVGKSVLESARITMDTMAEIVKKGIEAATLDLQRESEEQLWQEGILRHVPVVGRVFNWWSPPSKESGIKGRSLILTNGGVVESTENIYKCHINISGATGQQLHANRLPATPMMQRSVVSKSVFPTVEPHAVNGQRDETEPSCGS